MRIDDFNVSPSSPNPIRRAYDASIELAKTNGQHRSRVLQAMAEAIQNRQNDILEANTLDLEASRELGVSESVSEWLKLTPERLETTVQILRRLGELPDPIGRVIGSSSPLEQGQTYYQQIPIGVVGLIYEAFPELGAIAAGLCMKTANSLILLGGSEANYSNQVIAHALQSAIEDTGMPSGCLEVFSTEQGATIQDLLLQDQYINLIIPYGRPHLVHQVVTQSTVPILRSVMGNCYLYWSATANVEMVKWMILESHQSKPDPVNAIEKVLVAPNQKGLSLTRLWNSLQEEGFKLKGDEQLVQQFPELTEAEASEWSRPYLNKTIAFREVESLEEAISWMNEYSSGHSNCLATESYSESRQFASDVNSALTFINASPRFSRHQNRGEAIFLGVSNQVGYRRGLIGLESLTTIKCIVQGNSSF